MEQFEPVTITPSTYSRNSSVGSSESFNFTLSGADEYTVTDTFEESEATVSSSVTGDNLIVTITVLTGGTITGDIVVNGEATATITITVPSAMFTFSPESIIEETTETYFTINITSHPADFSPNDVMITYDGDIESAYCVQEVEDDQHYYIEIYASSYHNLERNGSVTFWYNYGQEDSFTKIFTIDLYPVEE